MRILLIDDDDVMRQYLRRVLQQEPSLRIDEARDGWEAWELMQQDPRPDLCLLDIMMPRMNGLELLQKMRADARFQRVKVIMCTVVRDPNQVQQAITLDVSDYSLKPFKNVTLVAMVRRALGITPDHAIESSLERTLATSVQESYPHRLAAFLAVAHQNLAELEKLIAGDQRTPVLEHLCSLRLECRSLGLGVLEEAINHLESAYINHQGLDISAQLEALQWFYRGLAEVLCKLCPELASAVESLSLQEA